MAWVTVVTKGRHEPHWARLSAKPGGPINTDSGPAAFRVSHQLDPDDSIGFAPVLTAVVFQLRLSVKTESIALGPLPIRFTTRLSNSESLEDLYYCHHGGLEPILG